MATLTEQGIVELAVGQEVNAENLKKCAWESQGHWNYQIYSSHYLYKSDLVEQFGITPRLKDNWERRGIEFDIFLRIVDGRVEDGSISKISETTLSARGCTNDLTPTQQELRVVRRIMEYILK